MSNCIRTKCPERAVYPPVSLEILGGKVKVMSDFEICLHLSQYKLLNPISQLWHWAGSCKQICYRYFNVDITKCYISARAGLRSCGAPLDGCLRGPSSRFFTIVTISINKIIISKIILQHAWEATQNIILHVNCFISKL